MELVQEFLLSFLKKIPSSYNESHTVLGVKVKWRKRTEQDP